MEIGKKFDYIVNTLINYESKIRTLNKLGLFDEAKWFESLAKDVGKLILGKEIINLNQYTSTYPGVDLRTSDGELDVQVSTTSQINAKVKHTFTVINEKNLQVKRVVFVFLSTENYNSKETFPSFFNPSKDVINITKFIEMIRDSIPLINGIYNIFINFFESGSYVDSFYKLLDYSKFCLDKNIESTINNNVVIERTLKINEDYKYSMIIGEAGSGKSVYAKKMTKDRVTIYVRAEQFVQKNLDEIFNFDILRAFYYLSNINLTIIIDSLEFLSDVHKDDLLHFFIDKITAYEYIKVIFTCRTSEVSRFTKLISDYEVYITELDLLDENELEQVFKVYPELREINETSSLFKMMKNPFYLNLMVKYNTSKEPISDANTFRKYIWDNVIANNSDKRDTFKSIVLDRAKSFSLYVNRDDYKKESIDSLIIDGVLIEYNNQVRAKFDIFEDICFEREIDSYFEKCKSDFNVFFQSIEQLGKCVHRRYQIWVGNKLWDKFNQDKFISTIVFSKSDLKWTKQTIIGILKSREADHFITNYIDQFSDFRTLKNFIEIMNLYGYSIVLNHLFQQFVLEPKDFGRLSLMVAIFKNKYYLEEDNHEDIIRFLASNVKAGFAKVDEISNISFVIIRHITEQTLKKYIENSMHYNEYISEVYDTYFKYSKNQEIYVQNTFDTFINLYKSRNRNEEMLSEKLIEQCLSFSNVILPIFHPKLICKMAFEYWTLPEKHEDKFYSYLEEDLRGEKKYGLNKNIDRHEIFNKVFNETLFFNFLFKFHFEIGVDFTIKLLNYSLEQLRINRPDEVDEEVVYFDDGGQKKYLAELNNKSWLAYRGFVVMPDLIILILQNLEHSILNRMESFDNDEERLTFAKAFKKKVFEESNNILLFPILVNLGIKYIKSLGSFAIELASNISFIYADLQRYSNESMSNLVIGRYSKTQMKTLKNHHLQEFRKTHLQEYVLSLQVIGYQKECFQVIDRHYLIFDKSHKNELLQIEKMDFRKAGILKNPIGIEVHPGAFMSSSSMEIVDEYREEVKVQNEDSIELNKIEQEVTNGNYAFTSILTRLIQIINNSEKYQISFLFDHRISKIFYRMILKKDEISKDNLNIILSYLFDRILPLLDHTGAGVSLDSYDSIFSIPFEKISKRNMIILEKIVFLSFIGDSNGIVTPIQNAINSNFSDSTKKSIVYTLINYSKQIRKYQLARYKKQFEEMDIDKPRLETISRGIFNTKANFKITIVDDMKYDIHSFMNIFRVKIDLSHEWIRQIVSSTLQYVFSVYSGQRREHPSLYLHDLKSYLSNSISVGFGDAKFIIDEILKSIHKSDYSHDAVRFINGVFTNLTPHYYDAFNDRVKRNRIEQIIDYLEKGLVNKMGNIKINDFSKSLLLMFDDYVGDISDCPTKYTYKELDFIKNKYIKYGYIDCDSAISNLYKLKIDLIFPHLLPALDMTLTGDFNTNEKSNTKYILLKIIMHCFYGRNTSDNFNFIKNDVELSSSFESILSKLISRQIPEAAIILDEFLIY